MLLLHSCSAATIQLFGTFFRNLLLIIIRFLQKNRKYVPTPCWTHSIVTGGKPPLYKSLCWTHCTLINSPAARQATLDHPFRGYRKKSAVETEFPPHFLFFFRCRLHSTAQDGFAFSHTKSGGQALLDGQRLTTNAGAFSVHLFGLWGVLRT